MCVILHKLKEQKPFTYSELKDACDTNPDGFSITTFTNNKANVIKILDKNDFLDKYKECLDKGLLDDIEYVIHCRIATNGKVCKNNCHPFENEHFILWHNGIISEFSKDKDKVDSEQFLNKYFTTPNIKTETILKRFETEPSSKFIIYRKDTGEIIQSKNFKEHNGNYISNDNFLYDWTKYYKKYNSYSWYDKYCDDYDYDGAFDDYYESKDKEATEELAEKNRILDEAIDYMETQYTSELNKEQLITYVRNLEDYIYMLRGF